MTAKAKANTLCFYLSDIIKILLLLKMYLKNKNGTLDLITSRL